MENTRSINNTSFIGSKINTSNLYKGNFNNTQLQNIELRQSNLLKCYLPNSNSINKNIFDCILDE